jgi:threonine dehydratase
MPFLNEIPTRGDIAGAHERIREFIHRTPVFVSRSANEATGAFLFFKCENFQKAGAFKFRGAMNAVLSLSDDEKKSGVATHSSGNHAAALALAAKKRGIKAYVVMPRTAPEIKKRAVFSYGAEVVFCEPTLEARETTLRRLVLEKGALFIHPYDNYSVIAGQATAAKELLEETKDLDFILAPVGGGGLLSGTALAAKFYGPAVEVLGAEPEGADDAYRSLRDGKIYPSISPETIADGLLTSLSERTFGIISKEVAGILTVKEESIISSMRFIWERMKIIVEPSSAVPLAAVFENRELFEGKRIGIILSGGNVDLDHLPWL